MGERQLDRLPVNDSEPEVMEICQYLSLYFAYIKYQTTFHFIQIMTRLPASETSVADIVRGDIVILHGDIEFAVE